MLEVIFNIFCTILFLYKAQYTVLNGLEINVDLDVFEVSEYWV